MKNPNFKFIFFLICLGLLAIASPARADEIKTVHLEVAALDQILFDDDFAVQSCPDNASSTNYTVNAWCAVEQIVASQGWSATSTWYSFGVMLNSVNQYDGSDGNYWLWFGNSEIGDTALNQHLLADGENLLLAYGTSSLKISASSTTPFINSTSTLSAFYFDTNTWQWLPAASSTFVVNGQEVFDEDGVLGLWINTATPYNVFVKKGGFLQSESIIITPQLLNIQIKFKVAALDQILYDGDFTAQSCLDSENGENFTVNAWCAVSQLIASQNWHATSTWYSFGVMLNSINQYDGSDGNYWLWFNNLNYGQTALDNHLLSQDEELLLIYGVYPLRIQTATTTPYVNSTTTVTVEQFGFDSSWNPTWSAAASSTLVVNGQEIFSGVGVFPYFVATTTSFSIFGRKAGFLDSPILVLTGIPQPETEIAQNNETEQSSGAGGGGGGGGAASSSHRSVNTEKAVQFLSSHQNSDGSIGDSILYSDWAAIALSASGESTAKTKLKNYLLGADYETDFGFRATDWERRAMALMALGINPYSGTSVDFISKIAAAFDGTQIGDPAIFNDDIFALFPLLKAGYAGSDKIIESTIKFILVKQKANGSWDSIDLTAAAMQALALALKTGNLSENVSGSVNQALKEARNFLRNSQGQNGGFDNNAISTAWAIQAIVALGETASSWENNGQNPLDFLASRQMSDGGFEEATAPAGTRIWTTAYAIPAALGKTWGEILGSFSKPAQNLPETASDLPSGEAISTPEQIIETPAPTIAFSTPAIENEEPSQNATSTVISNLPSIGEAKPASKIESGGRLASQPGLSGTVNKITEREPEISGAEENNVKNESRQNETEGRKEEKSPNLAAQISERLFSEQPKAAEMIFYASGATAVLLGLYLVVKFIMLL